MDRDGPDDGAPADDAAVPRRMSARQILSVVRPWVRNGSLDALKTYYADVLQHVRGDAFDEVFKQVFINTCMYGHVHVARWLYTLYQAAPLGFRLGLRPTFFYCRTLARARNPSLAHWLDTIIRETSGGPATAVDAVQPRRQL